MIYEVQVVSGCDGHGVASPLGQTGVGLVQRLVDVHKGIDDGRGTKSGTYYKDME